MSFAAYSDKTPNPRPITRQMQMIMVFPLTRGEAEKLCSDERSRVERMPFEPYPGQRAQADEGRMKTGWRFWELCGAAVK